jgi:hypothetical protein
MMSANPGVRVAYLFTRLIGVECIAMSDFNAVVLELVQPAP